MRSAKIISVLLLCSVSVLSSSEVPGVKDPVKTFSKTISLNSKNWSIAVDRLFCNLLNYGSGDLVKPVTALPPDFENVLIAIGYRK